MDHDTHQQAGSVGHNLALAAFDFFGRIIASWSAAFGVYSRHDGCYEREPAALRRQ